MKGPSISVRVFGICASRQSFARFASGPSLDSRTARVLFGTAPFKQTIAYYCNASLSSVFTILLRVAPIPGKRGFGIAGLASVGAWSLRRIGCKALPQFCDMDLGTCRRIVLIVM